jgi:hypothetical protein
MKEREKRRRNERKKERERERERDKETDGYDLSSLSVAYEHSALTYLPTHP